MRFTDVGGELTLQAQLKHGWEHIYRVIPYPRYDGEYEIANWYTATHPETPYQGNIIAAKPGPNRTRITMYNARVTVRDADGRAEKRWLKDENEYCDVLRGEFGLNLSDEEIKQCVAVMRTKGTGDAPHPFFLHNSQRPSPLRVISGHLQCKKPMSALHLIATAKADMPQW
jgi:N-hydroxyarylamine O-acetyltransferase